MVMAQASGRILSCLPVLAALGLGACSHPTTQAHVAAIYDKDGNRLPDSQASSPAVNWVTLGPDVPNYLAWNGVGGISPGCTATVLDQTPGKPEAEGPVYLITAGHCIAGEENDPNRIVVDADADSPARICSYVNQGGNTPRAVRLTADRIVYATMRGTDVAIYSVSGTTRAELAAKGVHALALSTEAPKFGEAILMPHQPQEGVWAQGLRLSSCTVGQTANIEEDKGHSNGVFRNHCSAVGGTSGAPVISVASGKIVGLLTTGTRDLTDGQPDCVDSRPCEVAADGSKHTYSDENYAQHVQQVAGCFDDHGVFSLDAAGCGLDKP